MKIILAQKCGLILTVFVVYTACAPSQRMRRQSPFGRMGASPFHSPMGPMGGMGHMGPSMGGPTMGGQSHGSAGSMFTTSVGLGCVRHELVCPQWCLAVDKNGCKSCPCGPAGGMNAIAGGPSGGPMGGAMTGGSIGGMPMGSSPSGGFMGGSGGGVSGGSVGGGGGGVSGGGFGGGGGGFGGGGGRGSATGGGAVTGGGAISTHTSTTTYMATKPVKECAATLLCSSTCNGYTLGKTSSSGCRSCSCPSSHHVSTATIKYIVQTVAPAKKDCTVTSYCMRSCSGGYVMSQTDGYGCPECSCIKVDKPYVPPIEIAVEPPPDNYQPPIEYAVEPPEYTYSLTCAAHSCNSGCTVGYKCGRDGCPSCECIHPSVVGLTTMHQGYIEKPLRCRNTLACPSRCSLGYKCGSDGCPTCSCLTATTNYVQTRPHYTAQTCTHTLTCAATCTNGYDLFTDGTSSCSKCACKQQVVYETRPQYTVQRPGPQYQIVQCPSTDSCSTQCPHGYDVIRNEGSCPKCQCKQAPVYYATMTSNQGCDNCHESYYTSGSTYTGGSGGSVGYVVTSGGGGSSSGGTSYLVSGGGVSGGGSGGGGSYTTGGSSYGGSSYGGSSYGGSSYGGVASYGSMDCKPLPPDCQPSCIVYDTPHCRKCACETSYVRFSHG